ncbi:MAG: CpaF family protein [Candidatus Eisenbacteria bacterium]|nr:CpaF family protein [Candidatus Eisenbacteria bacterium]
MKIGKKGREDSEGPAQPSARETAESPPKSPLFAPRKDEPRDELRELKEHLHRQLVERIDYSVWESLEAGDLRDQVTRVVEALLVEQGVQLTEFDRRRLIEEIRNETLGLGPIEQFLHDPMVSDILVNGHGQVYIERYGKLELTNARFRDDSHLMQVIDRIVSRVGRRVDESSPMVDARLPDGSRVNAIIPPLAIDGPVLSIRRFGVRQLFMNDLIRLNSITAEMAELIRGAVKAKLNVLISGGTGSGKTTLLNILSGYIPPEERIVTIEDAAELQLQQPHVVRLETRPPNIEGSGEVTQRDLVRNALRMRPDRIVVGEVRGDEVMDMFQAMNTGHEGSLTTIHANSPRDALARLETLMLLTGYSLPEKGMREMMSSALDLIVQVSRLSDGTRKIVSLSEVTGMEGEVVSTQEIFVFERTGVSESGEVLGRFRPTGVSPSFLNRLVLAGVNLPQGIFSSL